jgi:hypothetical protein
MLPKHYYAIVEGYNNKEKKKAEIIRKHAFFSQVGLKDGTTYGGFKNMWPLWFDEEAENDEWEMPDGGFYERMPCQT